MTGAVSPREAKSLLHAGAEVALLDIRDLADHGDGHPLFACPCPLRRLEDAVAGLVPRRSVPVILIDGGDGLVRLAAEKLAAMGYGRVSWIDGGLHAWRTAGYGAFEGVHVPSKVLGEILDRTRRPKMITPGTLGDWMAEGRPFHLFDVRPPDEFQRATIPGARNVPNGELAHRLEAFVDGADVPLVLTCAGRTRGIVGAVGLSLCGIPNPVYALEDGTQGWMLAGQSLATDAAPETLPAADRHRSRVRASMVARRSGVAALGRAEAERIATDPAHTCYVFDLRSDGERSSRPVEGARPVSGVQLVQATDRYIAVRRAQVLLLDDTGLRGTLAAAFLRCMGLNARVLALDDLPGEEPPAFPGDEPGSPYGARSAEVPADHDRIRFAAGRHEGDQAAARTYLAWEKGLVDRLDGPERAEFRPL